MTTAARKRSARAPQMLNTATLRLATAARAELGRVARTTHAAPFTGLYAAGPPVALSSSPTAPLPMAWSGAAGIAARCVPPQAHAPGSVQHQQLHPLSPGQGLERRE